MVQAPPTNPVQTSLHPPVVEAQKRGLPGSSYVFLAFVALIVLDFGARITYPYWHIDRYNSPNRSWIWWAVDDFRKQTHAPNMVLMGSSLMMAALHGGDATYLNVPQNVALHHRSKYLEDLLRQRTGKNFQTFAFAIGGQMASDAYVISSTLLNGATKPATIVYGVAPRDFMDNTFASPASTETFRYMSRLGNLSSLALETRPSFWEATDYMLGQISFLYGHKTDFNYLQLRYTKALLNELGYKDLEYSRVPFELRKIAMMDMPEDTGANEILIEPYGVHEQPYLDNSREYKARYSHFNKKIFNGQVKFLHRLLAYCKEQNIKLVLVNMPLTPDNVAIMPAGFYQNYLSTVSKEVESFGGQFLDLNQPSTFTNSCFADCVHLNGLGGKRFFQVLSDSLVQHQIVK